MARRPEGRRRDAQARSGAFEEDIVNSRSADGPRTNPEELIAAAHAGVFLDGSVAALSQ